MSALTAKRIPIYVILSGEVPLTLAASTAVYQGGMAVGNTADGTVTKGVAGTTTFQRIGLFAESLDNSASTATTTVMVRLDCEVHCQWFDNATGANKVLAANCFSTCYILDDHTVTLASSSNSKAGRVWGVDSTKGVLVEVPKSGFAL